MSNRSDDDGDEEKVVVIIDGNASMKHSYVDFSDSHGQATRTRWDYAMQLVVDFVDESALKDRKIAVIELKQKLQENLNDSQLHKFDNFVKKDNDPMLTTSERSAPFSCLRQAPFELKRSIQKLGDKTQLQSGECFYATDFCKGILMAANLLHNGFALSDIDSSEEATQAKPGIFRIVLITDAEHKITLENNEMTQLLVMLDILRAMECQLYVIGFNFKEQAEFKRAASAETAKVKSEQCDDKSVFSEECSFYSETEDAPLASCDDDDLLSVKWQNEKFLISIIEKTGGYVISAKSWHASYRKLSMYGLGNKSTKSAVKYINTASFNTEEKVNAETKRPFETIELEDTSVAKRRNVETKNQDNDDGNSIDDGIEILSAPLRPASMIESSSSLGEDSAIVSWSNSTNPNVDYPHKRVDCGVYDIEKEPETFCSNCYCVVCDIPAKQCQSWSAHCKERPEIKRSNQERSQHFQDILSDYLAAHNVGSPSQMSHEWLLEQILSIQEQYSQPSSASHSSSIDEAPGQNKIGRRIETSLSPNFSHRIYWDGSDDVSLDEWLERIIPSQISVEACSWIQVANTNVQSKGYSNEKSYFKKEVCMPALNRITKIINAGERVSTKEKDRCIQALSETTIAQGYTTGKWMLYLAPEDVDEAWVNIARATANGMLGCSAKISPAMATTQDKILCCVYVKDFSCREEVKRVLLALRHNLGFSVTCGFKPDFFTDLGIYTKNPWRLKPVLYKVNEVLESNFTTLTTKAAQSEDSTITSFLNKLA